MMLSAQAAPAGPAGIALLGVRNRLHVTLTALAELAPAVPRTSVR